VNIEALLIASGQNVKRLLAFGSPGPKKRVQAAALRPPTAIGHEISRAREHRSSCSWRPTKAFFNKLDRCRYSNLMRVIHRVAGTPPGCPSSPLRAMMQLLVLRA
jgi:hypothetical protein